MHARTHAGQGGNGGNGGMVLQQANTNQKGFFNAGKKLYLALHAAAVGMHGMRCMQGTPNGSFRGWHSLFASLQINELMRSITHPPLHCSLIKCIPASKGVLSHTPRQSLLVIMAMMTLA